MAVGVVVSWHLSQPHEVREGRGSGVCVHVCVCESVCGVCVVCVFYYTPLSWAQYI